MIRKQERVTQHFFVHKTMQKVLHAEMYLHTSNNFLQGLGPPRIVEVDRHGLQTIPANRRCVRAKSCARSRTL